MLTEIERKAWERRGSSEQHKPDMALKATLDQMERGELPNIKHIIVVAVQDIDGADLIHMLNAGTMSELAVEGALLRAAQFHTKEKQA